MPFIFFLYSLIIPLFLPISIISLFLLFHTCFLASIAISFINISIFLFITSLSSILYSLLLIIPHDIYILKIRSFC
ncbi:hypothetical protein C1645_792968 [Glomus cerebriforme]|uniref:Uncharacterized protein n=1 Tax=Glomus cerebriforme TaxID=658196 RepID=A0A397S695_9GLOM|nr:hypothetical protein C1645_792968 [Glomus cerebriforme]